ncbi:hypothetical protein FRC01_007052, partial [Tulasnella sp. 417]
MASASSTSHPTPSSSSSNRPPTPQERPPPPPPLITQVPRATGPSSMSPMSQSSAGTIDPRRRHSNSNLIAGPEASIDLSKIQAQLQDPNFVAALQNAVGTSNTGSQSPTTAIPMPPPSVTTRGAGPPAVQPLTQAVHQPSAPSSAPLKNDPWGNTAAGSGSRGQWSPPRRESQDWRSVGSSSGADPWPPRSGPSANASWAQVSSTAQLPSEAWAYAASGDWTTIEPANPTYSWLAPAAPPPAKPDPEPRSVPTGPRKPQPQSTPGSSGVNAESRSAVSTAPAPAQHEPQESPAHNEPPRKREELPPIATTSAQPTKLTFGSQRLIPLEPTSVDEQPPSPDKLYDSSRPDDDPELSAWRAIIKELGSIYRDYARYQELAQQRSELEALAARAAARSKPKPETNSGQEGAGPYSGKIKDLEQQIVSLSLSVEAKAAQWAAAATDGPITLPESAPSNEAAILRERRSKSLWPFEPPEGRYLSKAQ